MSQQNKSEKTDFVVGLRGLIINLKKISNQIEPDFLNQPENEKKPRQIRLFVYFRSLWQKSKKFQYKAAKFLSPRLSRRADWGRKQTSRVLVIFCALAVAATNLSSKHPDWWLNLDGRESDSLVSAGSYFEQPKIFQSLAIAPIADASQAISPEEMQRLKKEGEEATVMNQALVGITNPTPEEFTDSKEDVYLYEVQEGDTIGSIAQKYGITSSTIRWANGLEGTDMIHPGDQLFILPVTGVKYKVRSGDNIEAIAKKYKGKVEEIIAFNDLPANGELKEGEEIIIPDGVVEQPPATTIAGTTAGTRTGATAVGGVPGTVSPDTSRKFSKEYYSSSAHRFPWGWCTWYVASRRHIPWGGDAGTWLYHAKAYGANIGKLPKVGAIMVTGESRWGHVGIVEKVEGDTFTVSEMNYEKFGVKSTRTISSKAGFIKGFIY